MDDEVRKQIFDDFKKMVTTESVVGEPIYLGDATIVPFVDISFGFGSGSHTGSGASGGAGGGKVTPTAVLIMKGERVELFSIKNATPNGTIDKVLNMVPEVVSHFTKKKEKKEEINKSTLKTTQEFFTNVVASTPSSVYDDNESLAKLEINDTQKSELKILRYTNSRIKELTSIADKKKIDEKFMPKINAIISLLDKFALLDNLSPNQKNDLVEALIKIIAHDN